MDYMTKPTLRSRESLEKEILTQIALGTIKSFDDGFHDPMILEYLAQSLYTKTRLDVARVHKLPVHIVHALVEDSSVKVRKEITRWHWGNLSVQQREKTVNDFITRYKPNEYLWDPDMQDELIVLLTSAIKDTKCDHLVQKLLVEADAGPQISSALTNLDYNLHKCIKHLRQMPLTCATVHERGVSPMEIRIAHPDPEVRVNALSTLNGMSANALRNRFKYFELLSVVGNIHTKILALFTDDPNIQVLSAVVKRSSNLDILRAVVKSCNNAGLMVTTLSKIKRIEKRRYLNSKSEYKR